MPASSEPVEFATLLGGYSVPLPALLLALDLEQRGITFTADGDTLTVRPYSQLSPEDKSAIAKWKPHLLMLAAYTPDDSHVRPVQ